MRLDQMGTVRSMCRGSKSPNISTPNDIVVQITIVLLMVLFLGYIIQSVARAAAEEQAGIIERWEKSGQTRSAATDALNAMLLRRIEIVLRRTEDQWGLSRFQGPLQGVSGVNSMRRLKQIEVSDGFPADLEVHNLFAQARSHLVNGSTIAALSTRIYKTALATIDDANPFVIVDTVEFPGSSAGVTTPYALGSDADSNNLRSMAKRVIEDRLASWLEIVERIQFYVVELTLVHPSSAGLIDSSVEQTRRNLADAYRDHGYELLPNIP